jgi:catechol 2,3-dioxygenase-like lactoylglutathione lyase family enzyme
MSQPHDSASLPLDELRANLMKRASAVEFEAERIIGWLALCALLALLAALGGLSGGDAASAQAQSVARTQSHRQTLNSNEIITQDVSCIGMVVEDMDRSIEFYRDVLSFKVMTDVEVVGEQFERLYGVFGLRMRIVQMQLGDERIELMEYLVPRGRAYPSDSRSNDRWFQHIAIITGDMDRAYSWLREHKVRHASTGPQLLPRWNKNAGGISAFYFHDPDGHVLEILQFPTDKGNPKWRRHSFGDQLFHGIDHTAIVVGDTERSLRFYRDVLGLEIAGTSENYGTEQEHLNNVFGARLRITSLRARNGMGPSIELLEYLAPRDGRSYADDAQSNDVLAWQTMITTSDIERAITTLKSERTTWISAGAINTPGGESGGRAAMLIRDPDGHIVRLIEY